MAVRLRRYSVLMGIAIFAGLFGTLTGSALHSAAVPDPVYAACEDDECELGVCIDNAGGNTYCDKNSSGGCDTKGCDTAVM